MSTNLPSIGRKAARVVSESVIKKSKSDLKDYRLITLDNGLRALLISALKGPSNARDESKTEAMDASDEPMEESDGSSVEHESDTDSMTNEEVAGEREDEETVMKTLKPEQKKQAAAALCIKVGSFLDPQNIPGLAHFLEHMVFMGSEKYPDENKFDAFVSRHGGYDNAFTDSEKTVFQFEVQPKYFHDSLDIWAQFFISPLLKKDSVDREVQAVDSEFEMALNSDECRKEQLLGSLFPDLHPMGKFMWGNKISLQTNPEKAGIDVYKALKELHQRYYSSHFMTLAVQSPEELDTLEEWTREIFQGIPNNGKPPYDISLDPVRDVNPYHLIKIVPVRNIQELHLTWILSPQQDNYRTKPLHYISWLMGHEGKGSILSHLKKKSLGLALCSGNDGSGFDHNKTCSLLTVAVTLTENGFANYCEVMDIIFQYIEMMKNQGICERIYREIQKIEDIDFQFKEEQSPISNAVTQCSNVMLYPKEDILTGDELLFEYDPDCISNALNQLTRTNCLAFLSSPNHKSIETLHSAKKETWFGTTYCIESLPSQWRERWEKASLPVDPDLHLPTPNNFIAEDFQLKSNPKDRDQQESAEEKKYPVLISDSGKPYKLWFKQDDHFLLPKAFVRLHLLNPMSSESPENVIYSELLVQLLVYNLAEISYDADAASLTYGVMIGDAGGLIIKFSGYNDKLPVLLDTVSSHLFDFTTTEENFKHKKLQLKRTYYNILIAPKKFANNLRLKILDKKKWSLADKYCAIDGIHLRGFLAFVKSFLSSLYIESLVQGNFTQDEAKVMIDQFVVKSRRAMLREDQLPPLNIMKLPESTNICKVQALNKTNDNSIITVYFQVGEGDTDKAALVSLLQTIMNEPCFNILRTQKQLGYSVHVQVHNSSGILGLTVNVQTQNSKFSVEKTTNEIMSFILEDMVKILNTMKKEEFEDHVRSMIAVLKNEDSHLGEEVARNWHEIVLRDYNFDRIEREIRYLESCSLQDLTDFFLATCVSNPRMLMIQVKGNSVATNENTEGSDTTVSSDVDETGLDNLPAVDLCFLKQEEDINVKEPAYIMEIEKFKEISAFYPATHTIAK